MSSESDNALTIKPIGYFSSQQKWPYEAPSQPHLSRTDQLSVITLDKNNNFEQAIEHLKDISHIWVLFWFHHNKNWKPKTNVPRGSTEKISLFATRSPYRPNPIGLSLLEIAEIRNNQIFVLNADLLDQTPIIDIKPYHPEADVPQSEIRIGWMKTLNDSPFEIVTSLNFETQKNYLAELGVLNIETFCRHQLSHRPFDSQKKRVKVLNKDTGVLAYRTWRICFTTINDTITLENIVSGYTQDDLICTDDRWDDKNIHRQFNDRFNKLFFSPH